MGVFCEKGGVFSTFITIRKLSNKKQMKLYRRVAFLISLFTATSMSGQMTSEMEYVKNKDVLLESQLFKNPRSLKPIIDLKNDEELTTLF